MPVVPFIPAIAGVIGAGASIYGQSKAASAANRAADQNIALQREIYGKNEGYLSPNIAQGNTASSAISALLGLGGDSAAANSAFQNYENSTGHQFRLQTGMDALQASAATRGLLRSGSNLKNTLMYGQQLGTQDFGDYLGQVGTVANRGLGAASALAGVGQNYANAVGQQNTNAADATANAWLAGTSTFGNALSSLGSAFGSIGKSVPTSSYGAQAGNFGNSSALSFNPAQFANLGGW